MIRTSSFPSRKFLFFLALIVLIVLILLAIILIFLIIQHKTAPAPPASSSTYPANIDYEPITSYGTFNPDALTNPNVEAVDVNMNWSMVESREGIFNFTPADTEVAAWVKQGKKFTLIIRYINEAGPRTLTNCNGKQFLPAWEIARIHHFCDSDKGTIIPDYFNPVFEADLETYVKTIAEHFAKSPYLKSLLYVRVGVGLAAEGFYLMPCRGPGCDFAKDKAQLVSWGFSPMVWREWQEKFMSFYKQSFSYTRVIYPIVQLDTDPTTKQPVQMEVAYWAAANGIGVGDQGLVPYYPQNYAQIKTILAYILSYYPDTYIQFQTVASVTSSTEVQGDIQTADQLGARSIEWYAMDIVNPSYQPLFQQWQNTINSKFRSSK